jgi:hypothetical protein
MISNLKPERWGYTICSREVLGERKPVMGGDDDDDDDDDNNNNRHGMTLSPVVLRRDLTLLYQPWIIRIMANEPGIWVDDKW